MTLLLILGQSMHQYNFIEQWNPLKNHAHNSFSCWDTLRWWRQITSTAHIHHPPQNRHRAHVKCLVTNGPRYLSPVFTSHSRVLRFTPPPHVLLHSPHRDHPAQAPNLGSLGHIPSSWSQSTQGQSHGVSAMSYTGSLPMLPLGP